MLKIAKTNKSFEKKFSLANLAVLISGTQFDV